MKCLRNTCMWKAVTLLLWLYPVASTSRLLQQARSPAVLSDVRQARSLSTFRRQARFTSTRQAQYVHVHVQCVAWRVLSIATNVKRMRASARALVWIRSCTRPARRSMLLPKVVASFAEISSLSCVSWRLHPEREEADTPTIPYSAAVTIRLRPGINSKKNLWHFDLSPFSWSGPLLQWWLWPHCCHNVVFQRRRSHKAVCWWYL